MLTKTIDTGGAKFTVHTETGRHVFQKRVLLRKLPLTSIEEHEWDVWYEFVRVLAQSSDVTVPFAWPEATATLAELEAARDCWLDLPGHVLRLWMEALDAVDSPPAEADLTPAADPKND